MAIVRNPNNHPRCPKCGESYKVLIRKDYGINTGNYFLGDNFMGYDISGHVCNPDAFYVPQPIIKKP